jgi:hypothetical protein
VRRYTWQDNRRPLSERLEERLEKLKQKPAMRFCESCQTHKPNTKVFFNDFKACKLCQRIAHATERRHRTTNPKAISATSRKKISWCRRESSSGYVVWY